MLIPLQLLIDKMLLINELFVMLLSMNTHKQIFVFLVSLFHD